MGLPHIGSWGLPDFGITEFFGGNKTTQGGSNLFGPPQAQTPVYTPPTNTDMYSTVGSGSPQQVFNNPVPVQPQPQPQQQQQQPSSGNFMDYYGGWGQREAAADFLATFGGDIGRLQQAKGGGGGGQPQQPDYTNQINEIYNPAFQNLQNQENFLRNSQLPTAMGQIATNTQELQSNLQGQSADAQKGFATQQGVIEQNKESALQSAVRAYNSLKQQSQANFGQGSSTGPALNELAQQEYLRSTGGIQQAYSRQLGTILDAQSKTIDWVARESARILSASKQQEQEITNQFNQHLMEINNARGQLDSAKSAAKLQLVREAVAAAEQVKQAKDNYLMQLAGWKEQQQFLIDKGLSDLKQQYTTVASSPQFAQDAKTLGGIQPITATPKPISSSYRFGQQPKDEFADIINPFLA